MSKRLVTEIRTLVEIGHVTVLVSFWAVTNVCQNKFRALLSKLVGLHNNAHKMLLA